MRPTHHESCPSVRPSVRPSVMYGRQQDEKSKIGVNVFQRGINRCATNFQLEWSRSSDVKNLQTMTHGTLLFACDWRVKRWPSHARRAALSTAHHRHSRLACTTLDNYRRTATYMTTKSVAISLCLFISERLEGVERNVIWSEVTDANRSPPAPRTLCVIVASRLTDSKLSQDVLPKPKISVQSDENVGMGKILKKIYLWHFV